MQLFYRFAADAVVVLHSAYAMFIVLGLVAIYVGIIRKSNWVRNLKFRLVHLAMIVIVVAESWLGITCPLTVWEKRLRELSGDQSYQGDFIANLVHDLLFFDAEPWVFTVIYSAFGLLVAATFVLAPPRRNVKT
ncbi:MAG: DUF2784 domain-containing protein [Planctomycetota bacterium]|nr:DUF2784 domain-containing protein [Planctomycetota bacterium]